MTHLILHKVRGEPAFDIAEQMEDGAWIIPTSGHRAYPLRNWLLTDLSKELDLYSGQLSIGCQDIANHPDHYKSNDDLKVTTKPKSKPQQLTLTLDDLD